VETTGLAFVEAINMCFVCGNFSFRLKAFETEEKSILYESMSRLVVDKRNAGMELEFCGCFVFTEFSFHCRSARGVEGIGRPWHALPDRTPTSASGTMKTLMLALPTTRISQ